MCLNVLFSFRILLGNSLSTHTDLLGIDIKCFKQFQPTTLWQILDNGSVARCNQKALIKEWGKTGENMMWKNVELLNPAFISRSRQSPHRSTQIWCFHLQLHFNRSFSGCHILDSYYDEFTLSTFCSTPTFPSQPSVQTLPIHIFSRKRWFTLTWMHHLLFMLLAHILYIQCKLLPRFWLALSLI